MNSKTNDMNNSKDEMLIKRIRNYLKEHGIHRISNYESYEVVKDFMCPSCGKSADSIYDGIYSRPTLVGWSETQDGFMVCFECPECFEKFRWHGQAFNRCVDEDEFLFYVVYPKARLQFREHDEKSHVS